MVTSAVHISGRAVLKAGAPPVPELGTVTLAGTGRASGLELFKVTTVLPGGGAPPKLSVMTPNTDCSLWPPLLAGKIVWPIEFTTPIVSPTPKSDGAGGGEGGGGGRTFIDDEALMPAAVAVTVTVVMADTAPALS